FKKLAHDGYLKDCTPKQFVTGAASFLTQLNAIHPFREGNGRTQTTFLALLADQAGHPLDLDRLKPKPFLAAMIKSFTGNEKPLVRELTRLIA
ncbi:MAG TPA: Fic family protein, partial [Candidatus Binatia bacterium]|nr:Fic family protein [Candidatus Binatia bacterium]